MIRFNEVGTAMLQDAIWVNADWIAQAGNEDVAQRFLQATYQGWIFCRDNFDQAVDIVLANGSALGASHQAWQLNEINNLIWPSPAGIGVVDQALWDQTVDVATTEIPEMQGVTVSNDVFRNDLSQAANAVLEAEGLDTIGADFERIEVTLNPGGE